MWGKLKLIEKNLNILSKSGKTKQRQKLLRIIMYNSIK